MRLRIVTDSTADIPKALAEELDISIVPLKVHFDEQSYLDNVDLLPADFYEKLTNAEKLPTTSQPSPVDFTDLYERLAEEGEVEIISIHLSGSLSGTYQTATLAAGMVEDKVKVHVVDSKSASYVLGAIVVAVARAARDGKTGDECLAIGQKIMENQRVFFVVDTLTYLQKGGRIGKASAIVGSLLNVKPILTLDGNGVVAPVEKVRGKKKAVGHILERCKELAGDEQVAAAVLYSTDEEEARTLMEQVKRELNTTELILTQIGPVIGTYGGPGLLAITFYKV
ncbi:DegV family protein [Aneurinibacillus terranovensis]|uniref:DegV family protein n=1 Tax=Aneurinibacillus terranovensis TaxID=278991 RepID=UPI0003F64D64|nr:DegV family protein [Aneurinibacillus terranovensis]